MSKKKSKKIEAGFVMSGIPRYCKIVKGSWLKNLGDEDWHLVIELRPQEGELSTESFAWVPIADCIFSAELPKGVNLKKLLKMLDES